MVNKRQLSLKRNKYFGFHAVFWLFRGYINRSGVILHINQNVYEEEQIIVAMHCAGIIIELYFDDGSE